MSERSASVGSPDGSGLDGAPGDGDPGVPDRAGSVPPPSDTRFGEQGGLLTYGSYLRLEGLLGQQQLESVPPAHDELLFITIHQVYELWFKQLLHELGDARDRMLVHDAYTPRVRLERCRVIMRVLVEQVDVLETMTPQDFGVFRSILAPASGFQSVQFRELEFLSGAKDPAFLRRFRGLTDSERDRLERRLVEPSLWDGFLAVLGHGGFDVSTVEARTAALHTIAYDRGRYGALWDLAEALLEHDAFAGRWRARHVLMVERQIGLKSGTGGSSGASYLRSRLDLHYYPELWELRNHL
ncbi:MAG: Tryptophan 2,3-dioxygenase [Cryptosporangiaceae bacterium]|jgi:tryptophan 2,3-dioxygenase|nr:Tryptophan 2,3-dioxygenase [Cryptosporangiaceae bacterium]